ncbi:MAG: epoxyqueuosine reductase QueH [bacterium]|nr:epoxyqueuosine reductase QueH [bacterium]
MKKKLLLHVCCAPCAVYVFTLLEEHYDVTGFFYNPNIQPLSEYQFRKEELERLASLKNWNIITENNYDMKKWFSMVEGLEHEPEKGRRCSICFNMRLEESFQYAAANGFDVVTSTLSISPYKVTRQINEEGEKLAATYGVEFLPENFKKKNGYNIGKKMARDLEIKQQNYCGCVYSKIEKEMKKGVPKVTKVS